MDASRRMTVPTASGLNPHATPLAAFLRMETCLAVPKQRATHGVRSPFAHTFINARRAFAPLSTHPSPAVDLMSLYTCRTGMPSGPAAAQTSIFRTAFFSAVIVIVGAGGRSSNGAHGRSFSIWKQSADGSEDDRISQISMGPGHKSTDGSPERRLLSERLRTRNVFELLGLQVD
jgi:hypothetical protein